MEKKVRMAKFGWSRLLLLLLISGAPFSTVALGVILNDPATVPFAQVVYWVCAALFMRPLVFFFSHWRIGDRWASPSP